MGGVIIGIRDVSGTCGGITGIRASETCGVMRPCGVSGMRGAMGMRFSVTLAKSGTPQVFLHVVGGIQGCVVAGIVSASMSETEVGLSGF